MTTKSRIITNALDISCPDEVIDSWLQEWNKCNLAPLTLNDLDDITYDFICRAVDYGANQELRKTLDLLLKIHPDGSSIAGELLNKRRPSEFSPNQQLLDEIKTFKAFVITEMTRLEERLKSMDNVSA